MANSLRKSFQMRNMQPKDLVVCLLGYFHHDKVLKEGGEMMFSEVREKCEECKSHTDFWSIISRCFTFYSYDFIKEIATLSIPRKKTSENLKSMRHNL